MSVIDERRTSAQSIAQHIAVATAEDKVPKPRGHPEAGQARHLARSERMGLGGVLRLTCPRVL